MGSIKREAPPGEFYRLDRAVRVSGRSFFGRKTEIVFEPHGGIGWEMIERAGKPTPIDPTMADTHHQQITLRSPAGAVCHVFEHVGALRNQFVGVKFAALGGHAPYFGGSLELFEALRCSATRVPTLSMPRFTVSGPIRWDYPKPRGGRRSYVDIRPREDGKLQLDITIAFPGIGELNRKFSFPDPATMREVCGGLPAGYPRSRHFVARAASALGWPHKARIAWVQELGADTFLDTVLRHRALDLLGALSLLSGKGRFMANVTSVCAGHEADMQVVPRAYRHLYRIA